MSANQLSAGEIQGLLNRMLTNSRDILALELDQEDAVEQLDVLQQEQEALRNLLDESISCTKLPSDLSHILVECKRIGLEIERKFDVYKGSLGVQIQSMQQGNLMRKAYGDVTIQANGCFVDKQR